MSSDRMQKSSFANGGNALYIEEMYAKYKQDPTSVAENWRQFFEGFEFGASSFGAGGDEKLGRESAKVEAYINAYRRLGHLSADLNPLEPRTAIRKDMLPESHGLKDVDPSAVFHPANLPSKDGMTFREIDQLMLDTYCRKIGAEFREMDDIEAVVWFQSQMEGCRNAPVLANDLKKRVLAKLVEAEGFERFLQARYLGQKRFSLEGADSYIPLMDIIFEEAAKTGCEEVCIGMAHRGRLNTLVNALRKSYESILKEFEGSEYKAFDIDGDVKYHLGFASEVKTISGKDMRLYLSPNPSHLEVVNPVVEGFAASRQRLFNDSERNKIIPLLIHGDASFIGQGLVAETLNLSQLPSYKTGGTIHIIINNQVGFTTNPSDARSTTYASSLAKFIAAPVLHVNADDPEAVAWCGMLAVAFRQKFKRDVVIDLIGYRRHGHNETDEPGFTQPLMYKKINAHPTVLEQYSKKLVGEAIVSQNELNALIEQYKANLQDAFEKVRGKNSYVPKEQPHPQKFSRSLHYIKVEESDVFKASKTSLSKTRLVELGKKMTTLPASFHPHPKIVRLFESRQKMLDGDGALDWAMGELLAFASLAAEGHHVRLSGQDCQRGTFSSRHAVLRDFETGQPYNTLGQLDAKQAAVDIINSPLSELGVMGFDYGYTIADPDALVLWEAQFGDFANGAQIIIDQFLVASEAKWKQTSGLVLMLPHGYEGQGPEHSSGRPERFLQLCGNLNIQVAIPTTPSQHFHILRRQLKRDYRKPLVLMTPKSLLRHPKVISSWNEFEQGTFAEVLDDNSIAKPAQVSRLVLCSGKIFYELIEAREKQTDLASEVALVRIEQIYPFPEKMVAEIFKKYAKAKEVVWAQEEPQNMGGWTFVRPRLEDLLKDKTPLRYCGRKSSGTTAEGSSKAHAVEQSRIIQDALGASAENPVKAKVTAGQKV